MDLDETKKLLEEIKQLDLTLIEKENLIEYVSKLNGHASAIFTMPAGTIICRSVENFLENRRFPNIVQEVSYNPNLGSCRFNRANWEKETTFYGSISDNLMQSKDTSAFEIISLKDNESNICQETVFVGKWVLQQDLELVFIGGGDTLLNQTQKTLSRTELFDNYINEYPESALSLKMIDNFLCNEFSKDVPDNQRWLYKISAAYATFLKQHKWPGMIYPSVKSYGGGLNVAIFPHIIDSEILKLEYVTASIFYKRGKDIVNEYVMEARPNNNNELLWTNMNSHHLLPVTMKDYYTGKSDDNSFAKYIPMTDLGGN